MTERVGPLTSSPGLNRLRHRSQSYRERPSRTPSDIHHQNFERLQRDFEQSFDNPTPSELYWPKQLSPKEYLENIRDKYRQSYNQLMQQKVEEVEEYLNQRHDEERRSAEKKFRKTQMANEKYRLQTIKQIVQEREAICEEKLAAQKRLYDRLLDEQARRFHAEKNLQSFEHLNVAQLKDRLSRVEHSNQELKQLIRYLIQRKPLYKNTLHIRNYSG